MSESEQESAGFTRAGVRALLEELPVFVYQERVGSGAAAESSFIYRSARIQELTGYGLEEYDGRGEFFYNRVLHPSDREKVLAESRRTVQTGEMFRHEYRLIHKDGSIVWVLDIARLVGQGADGEQVWDGVLVDITERKRAEIGEQDALRDLREVDRVRRKLLTDLVNAEEAERGRIAADLHDDSVQALTAIALRLDMQRARMDEERAGELDRVRNGIETVIAGLRKMTFDLRPPILKEEGLLAAIQVQLEVLGQETGMVVHLRGEIDRQPAPVLDALAYRVIREALINVRKHARAATVEVTVAGNPEEGIRVSVRDDGVGFDPVGLVPEPGHLGLEGMRERVEAAGGQLELESGPDRGTLIRIWIPAGD